VTELSFTGFVEVITPEALFYRKCCLRELAIPEWHALASDVDEICRDVVKNRAGQNAQYIPPLKDADPERFAVAVCTVDGQSHSFGDARDYYTLQSVSKPVTYAVAVQQDGAEFVDEFVWCEASGRPFNSHDLLPDQRPFNPCVNSGAIMTAGLVASGHPDKDAEGVAAAMMDTWQALCGGGLRGDVRLDRVTMEAEKATADNNFAIAYNLRGRRGLPRGTSLEKMLDLYFACCSIEVNTEMLSIAAATLANGGVNPFTQKEVFSASVVRRVLCQMASSGMYDGSGAFTLRVGLPAKSGVAGAVLVVVPNVAGFASFSPRLDAQGNSVRGIEFFRRLTGCYRFHVFEPLAGGNTGMKQDPRGGNHLAMRREAGLLAWAVRVGDAAALRIHRAVVSVMCDMALVDGDSAAKFDCVRFCHKYLFGEPIAEELVEHAATVVSQLPKEERMRVLMEGFEGLTLTDNLRLVLLEAAFRVAIADEGISDAEMEALQSFADSIRIHRDVLDFKIAHYRIGIPVAPITANTDMAKVVAGLEHNLSATGHQSHLNLFDIGGSHHHPGSAGDRSGKSAALLRRVKVLEREREQLRNSLEATKRVITLDRQGGHVVPLLLGMCVGGMLVAALVPRRG